MAAVPTTHEVGASQEEVDDLFLSRGWSDGLPVVPPTGDRVTRMLGTHDPDEVIGPVPVSNRVLNGRTLAVNAVMAGCRPEHFPVLRAAATAMLRQPFNLAGVSATTHPAGPLVIVSGPVVEQLGFNAGSGCLGPGNRPGATIGRAIRLVLLAVGGAWPGEGDRATHGHPGKYSYVLAEDEASTPWEPLRVRASHGRAESTVTLVAAEAPRNVNDHGSTTAGELIMSIAGTAASLGHNNLHRGGPIVLVLGPEHAAVIERAGLSCEQFVEEVFATGQVPISLISDSNLERFRRIRPERFAGDRATATIPVTLRSEDLIPVVSGGAGRHSMVIPSFGISSQVTVPITSLEGTNS